MILPAGNRAHFLNLIAQRCLIKWIMDLKYPINRIFGSHIKAHL